MDAVLHAERLTKRFGGVSAVEDVDLTVGPGELLALIGPNGAGKTTLVSLLAGSIPPDSGAIVLDGRPVTAWTIDRRAQHGIIRSFQIPSVFPELTALENVALAVQARSGHSFRFWRAAEGERPLRAAARAKLDALGLGRAADRPARLLSHGERRLLEIAMALASGPRLLLLDEPMAGLGHEEAREMVRVIAGLKGAFATILIEHDMDAVFSLADRVMVLVAGRVVACGDPAAIRADPAVRLAYLGEDA